MCKKNEIKVNGSVVGILLAYDEVNNEQKRMERSMKRTVIFDLDGLLIDSEIISYQLYQDLIKQYGHSFTVEDYAQNFSGKTAIDNMEAIIKRFQLPISLKEGLDFTSLKEKEYFIKGVTLKSGAKELLDYLKQSKCKIVLASSSTNERALCALTQHKIESYFDEMVFGTEVENGKPNPDIFLKACEKAKVDPESCIVLEDSEAGIQASYSAHIPVICVPDMKKPEDKFQKMTEAILPSLLDVMFYFRKESNVS